MCLGVDDVQKNPVVSAYYEDRKKYDEQKKALPSAKSVLREQQASHGRKQARFVLAGNKFLLYRDLNLVVVHVAQFWAHSTFSATAVSEIHDRLCSFC